MGSYRIFDILSEPKRVVSVVFLTLLALSGYYGGKVIWDRYHPPPVKGFPHRTVRSTDSVPDSFIDSKSKVPEHRSKVPVHRRKNPNIVVIALQLPENGNNGRSTVQEDVMQVTTFDDNDEESGPQIFRRNSIFVWGFLIRLKLNHQAIRELVIRQMICCH